MKLSDPKRRAMLDLVDGLSTPELETLISDLIEIRANAQPEVPLTLEEFRSGAGPAPNISVVSDPYMSAKLLRDGGVRIWLRNPGIGWFAFNLATDKAGVLRDFLVAGLPEGDASSNFFSDDIDEGGAAH